MFAHPRLIHNPANPDKPRMVLPDIWSEFLYLMYKSFRVVSLFTLVAVESPDPSLVLDSVCRIWAVALDRDTVVVETG